MKGYTSSLPLFDREPPPVAVEPVDPSVLETDKPRLSTLALNILARLKQGPALNHELIGPECGGMRIGSRLNDLKKAGVIWTKRHIEGSVWEYRLISCPAEIGEKP